MSVRVAADHPCDAPPTSGRSYPELHRAAVHAKQANSASATPCVPLAPQLAPTAASDALASFEQLTIVPTDAVKDGLDGRTDDRDDREEPAKKARSTDEPAKMTGVQAYLASYDAEYNKYLSFSRPVLAAVKAREEFNTPDDPKKLRAENKEREKGIKVLDGLYTKATMLVERKTAKPAEIEELQKKIAYLQALVQAEREGVARFEALAARLVKEAQEAAKAAALQKEANAKAKEQAMADAMVAVEADPELKARYVNAEGVFDFKTYLADQKRQAKADAAPKPRAAPKPPQTEEEKEAAKAAKATAAAAAKIKAKEVMEKKAMEDAENSVNADPELKKLYVGTDGTFDYAKYKLDEEAKMVKKRAKRQAELAAERRARNKVLQDDALRETYMDGDAFLYEKYKIDEKAKADKAAADKAAEAEAKQAEKALREKERAAETQRKTEAKATREAQREAAKEEREVKKMTPEQRSEAARAAAAKRQAKEDVDFGFQYERATKAIQEMVQAKPKKRPSETWADMATKLKATTETERLRLKAIPKEERDPEEVQTVANVPTMLNTIEKYRVAAVEQEKKREEAKRQKEAEEAERVRIAKEIAMREEQVNAMKQLYKLRWDLTEEMKREFDEALEKARAADEYATKEMRADGKAIEKLPWVSALGEALKTASTGIPSLLRTGDEADPLTNMTYEQHIAVFAKEAADEEEGEDGDEEEKEVAVAPAPAPAPEPERVEGKRKVKSKGLTLADVTIKDYDEANDEDYEMGEAEDDDGDSDASGDTTDQMLDEAEAQDQAAKDAEVTDEEGEEEGDEEGEEGEEEGDEEGKEGEEGEEGDEEGEEGEEGSDYEDEEGYDYEDEEDMDDTDLMTIQSGVALVFTLRNMEVMKYANDLKEQDNAERLEKGKKRVTEDALRRLTPALGCFSDYLRKKLVYVYPPQLLPKSKAGTDVGNPFFMVVDDNSKYASYMPGQRLLAQIKEKKLKVVVLKDKRGSPLLVQTEGKGREHSIGREDVLQRLPTEAVSEEAFEKHLISARASKHFKEGVYTDDAYLWQRVTFPGESNAASSDLDVKPLGLFPDTNLFDYQWDNEAGTVKVTAFLAPNPLDEWEEAQGAPVPEDVKYVPPAAGDLPDVFDSMDFDAAPSSALSARTRLLRRAAPGSGGGGGAKRRFGARTVPTAARDKPAPKKLAADGMNPAEKALKREDAGRALQAMNEEGAEEEMMDLLGGALGGEKMTDEERAQAREDAEEEKAARAVKKEFMQLMKDLAVQLGEYTQDQWIEMLSWCFNDEEKDDRLVPYSLVRVQVNPTDDLELTDEEKQLWMDDMDRGEMEEAVQRDPALANKWIRKGVFDFDGYRKSFVADFLAQLAQESYGKRWSFKQGFRDSVAIIKSRPKYKFGGYEEVEKMTDKERDEAKVRIDNERIRQNTIAKEEGRKGASDDVMDGVNVTEAEIQKMEEKYAADALGDSDSDDSDDEGEK